MKHLLALLIILSCLPAAGQLHVTLDHPWFADSLLVRHDGRVDTFTAERRGMFDFDLPLTAPTRLTMMPARSRGTWELEVVGVPCDTLTMRLTNAYTEGWITTGGTGFYAHYPELDSLRYFASLPLETLYDQTELNPSLADSLAPQIEKARADLQTSYLIYIEAHPASELAALLIAEMDDGALIRRAVAALTPEVREGRMRPFFLPQVEEAQRESRRAAGVEAPAFALPQPDGTPLTLASLRGRYVVLDFWGSWCGWCIKAMPRMKALYARYAPRLEVVGIDCHDTEARWLTAIEQHALPWRHVRIEGKDPLLEAYGVSGFPTMVLIDPDGRIAASAAGESEAFYQAIDEAMQEN